MPKITIHLGGREPLEATISMATPMGLLGTEAIVRLGPAIITGPATAVRALADVLTEAADLADEYDADPQAWKERERARRASDR